MTAAGYLLDTNAVSETRKLRANPRVTGFLEAVNGERLFLSVLTLGELRKGVAAKRRTDAETADRLAVWVDEIERNFADRVLPVDAAAARIWGELSAARSLPVVDTLIAATAMARGLTLVTRNTRDVTATGVTVLDPWNAR
jgi:predicted nucleic acid-binding protein